MEKLPAARGEESGDDSASVEWCRDVPVESFKNGVVELVLV